MSFGISRNSRDLDCVQIVNEIKLSFILS